MYISSTANKEGIDGSAQRPQISNPNHRPPRLRQARAAVYPWLD